MRSFRSLHRAGVVLLSARTCLCQIFASGIVINPSATSSPSSQSTDSVWHIPLVGLSDSPSTPWGANVTAPGKTSQPYAFAINNDSSVPSPAPQTNSPTFFTQAQIAAAATGDELVAPTPSNDTNAVALGPSSIFNITGPALGEDAQTFTIPLGLNLGRKESWNGSLILGGSYDANRVTAGSWACINAPSDGSPTFLSTGMQTVTNVTIQQHTYTALLDFNSENITLPHGKSLCNTNFNVSLAPGATNSSSASNIEIPASLTVANDRCSQGTDNSNVILGKPFFQAAYLMIPDTSGRICLAGAHQYDLPPSAQTFDASQTLKQAAASSSTAPSSIPAPSSTGKSDASSYRSASAGAIAVAFWIASQVLFCWI